MNIHTKFLSGLLLAVGVLVGCGDSGIGGGGNGGDNNGGENTGGNPTDGGGGNGGNAGGGGAGGESPFPPKPELGAQIDRMGRPAINTALNGAFVRLDDTGAPVASEAAARALEEDEYNENGAQTTWEGDYFDVFAANLAVIDSVNTMNTGDDAACEDQLTSCGNVDEPDGPSDCYAILAGVLTDDRLWMNTAGSGCFASPPAEGEGYLAVEANALGLANTGCGGRRPIDDVIETSFSVLVAGAFTGVDDGITAPPGLHPELFPYLDQPHAQ